MRTGQARKRDANEKAIVDALRRAGATIVRLSVPDAPDLLVGYRGRNWLLEVKTARGRTKVGQLAWAMGWNGHTAVARTVDEAFNVIGIST